MPGLDTLAQLTQVGDRWVRDGSPLVVLVDAVFPVMKEAIPELLSFHLYQAQANQLISTQNGDSISLDIPIQQPQKLNGRWFIPLANDHVIVADVETDIQATDQADLILGAASAQLSLMIERSSAHRQQPLQTVSGHIIELSNVRDENTLLNKTCDVLVQRLGVEHASVILHSQDGRTAWLAAEQPELFGVGIQMPLEQPLYAEVQQKRDVVIVADVASDERLTDDIREQMIAGKIKSLVHIPILDAVGKVIGTVGLETTEGGEPLGSDAIESARTIVTQVAATLQNIRLTANSKRLARQMEGIVGFGQAIQATFDVGALLEITLLNLLEIVPTHHVGILMYVPSVGSLRVVGYLNEEGETAVDPKGILSDLELVGTTAQHVWTSKEPLLTANLQNEGFNYTFDPDIRSSMSILFHQRGTAAGIIEVGNRETRAYAEVDNAVFQQLASQLSVALENCEAYSQSKEIARGKTLVNDIASQLQQQVEVDEIMRVTVQELGQALGARRARIRLNPSAVDGQRE